MSMKRREFIRLLGGGRMAARGVGAAAGIEYRIA
jgi:hypothetical protein